MFAFLTDVRLKILLLTFAAGAAVMAVYARVKVRNGIWLGIPDLVSSVLVISLGTVTYRAVMTVAAKWSKYL